MKKLVLLITFLFSLSQIGFSSQAVSRGLEVPFVNKKLANGLEIIVLQDRSVPLVTVEAVVRNGSFTEPPELNGLSHLYEHMFFNTNRAIEIFRCDFFNSLGRSDLYLSNNCPAAMRYRNQVGDVSYLRTIDEIGFLRNGSTHEEHVNYYFYTTSKNLSTMMRLMRDALVYPSFNEEELRKEIQIVLSELDRQMSEPGYYLERTMMDKLFYKYPSRKNPGGTRETVASATVEKMRLIQSRYYVPNNTALVITGDVDPEEVFKLAEQLFGSWQKGEDPFVKYPLVEHPPLQKSEAVILTQDVDNVIVQFGWHGPSIGKDDASTYAADVFSFIVEQPSSRLQKALIDSELATSLNVHYYTQRNVGPIRITMITSVEKARQAIKKLKEEIASFMDEKYFTDEELENAKVLLEAENFYRREKLSEYTHELGFWWAATGTEYYRNYYKNLRAVSRQDISRYISTYIHKKPYVVVVMLSAENQKKLNLTEKDLLGD
ncbi:MAG: insulinase family protein [Pyrinomonadaceae bacterium]|nr:insulinase family protein [Pyrinomonadaceae bacterium]